MNPLRELLDHGQSYWLDNLTRALVASGELARRVNDDGLRGVTSNPAIFEKAITASDEYDAAIAEARRAGLTRTEIYELLVTTDIRNACDVLRPVHDESDGADGFVSLEVSPHLAHDTEGSVAEARRLHAAVDRPNLMIKIPGTAAGLPAIEQLLYEGIDVNITLLFSVERYAAVAERYLRALERRVADGAPVDRVASVASFFLSRIDVLVDRLLAHRSADPRTRELAGRTAVANARTAYRRYEDIVAEPRWRTLADRGARVQRLLWASTGTKNPDYSDVAYVEPLIGPDTVSTMPDETADAFRDHGRVATTLTEGTAGAARVLETLGAVGIDLEQAAAQLENEGIQKFIDPFDALLEALDPAG